jgi:hypothetical protein
MPGGVFFFYMAEEQGFEPWMGYKPMPVFKTGAFNHSATPPNAVNNTEPDGCCKQVRIQLLSKSPFRVFFD